MLERVHHFWIEGVLNQSLYQVARLELGLVEQPEAIEHHPWKLVMQQPGRVPRSLPNGTSMEVVFDQFDKTLLLLGAPGSGKTTLLLELARDLIGRVKQDPEHPIPVVFNLSSWALRRPSLEAWLVDELSERYDVPRKLGERWVAHDEVLPLLDGLDEVALDHRDACVAAINAFHQGHGLLPLVVCSRRADYEALTVRLCLPGAVTIQPLTRPQVDGYLRGAGTVLSGISAALREDDTLWELLDTPLMLSVFALAYQGRMASNARIARLKGSLEARRAALFDAYIEAMFRRRDTTALYTSAQTRHWLSWLAQAMVRHDQTVFYLEHMQPDWLPKVRARLHRIGSELVAGWLIRGFIEDEIPARTIPNEGIHRSLRNALGFGLLVGLLLGLGFGLEKGGYACIQHGVLRLLLWHYDDAPLRYVRFLHSAVERLFLRRVGGGYLFVPDVDGAFCGVGEALNRWTNRSPASGALRQNFLFGFQAI